MLLLSDQTLHSINKASQYMQNPTDDHLNAVKKMLRYLKGTLNYGLILEASESISINGYADTDWANDPEDRKSTAGYCIYLGNNPISWC